MIAIDTVDLHSIGPTERNSLTTRSVILDPAVRRAAAEIVEAVRLGGDGAVADANRRYGGGQATAELMIAPRLLKEALGALPTDVLAGLESSAEAIHTCHLAQLPTDSRLEPTSGVTVDRRWSPLKRAGAYVPGGGAAYPSTLLMAAVPARIAGVGELAVATPARPDGKVPDVVLAAAALMEIDEVYVAGGAQAIAALAHGTETLDSVDKIVGPGNPWVTAAKLEVFGTCGIDLPAGPSEALILADTTADPRLVAADLLCQAEHGVDSPVVLVTTDADVAAEVRTQIDLLLLTLGRPDTMTTALTNQGLIVIAENISDALDFAEAYGPEHLSLHLADADAAADQVTSAGSVFVGAWAPESVGDYATGANHVLPTGGLAAAYGPLSVEDFGSWRQVQYVTRDGLARLRPTITALADAEGFPGHALAADIRFRDAV